MTARRIASAALLSLAGVLHLTVVGLGQDGPSTRFSSPTAANIAGWIKQLDADRFRVREAATAELTKAGRPAVAPLAKAATEGGLEVTLRAVQVLAKLAMVEDPITAQTAREALEDLAEPGLTAASDRAAAALESLNAIEAKRALGKVLKLGAEYGPGTNISLPGPDTRTVENHLLLRKQAWNGDSDGLKLFRWLKDVDYVSIYGIKLTDDAVPHLKGLKHLRKLELYGTRISDNGVEQLRAALPGTEIDLRRGGLLGVRGSFGGNCVLGTVQANSAAAKAGLRDGDIVLECDGKPMETFRTLLEYISTKEGGDKLKLIILRNDAKLKFEVTLGEWGDR